MGLSEHLCDDQGYQCQKVNTHRALPQFIITRAISFSAQSASKRPFNVSDTVCPQLSAAAQPATTAPHSRTLSAFQICVTCGGEDFLKFPYVRILLSRSPQGTEETNPSPVADTHTHTHREIQTHAPLPLCPRTEGSSAELMSVLPAGVL